MLFALIPAPGNIRVVPKTEVTNRLWRPIATLATLQKRAELLAQIRSFFARARVMEVETPLLGRHGVTDLHIECIEARVCGETRYLQSSPEYFMKRLLAAGSGSIYSLGKVFRDEEQGRRHRPEFTLLEWYRPGWDEQQLMAEIALLIQSLAETLTGETHLPIHSLSYAEVFRQTLDINPHSCELSQLQALAAQTCGGDWRGESRATLLDLLFSTQVEARLPGGLVFVHGYPACMAALARLGKNPGGETIARRFELFLNGMELGNGYFELTDAVEQRKRFEADQALRAAHGKKAMAGDDALLAALSHGLPSCAGVAIGVDRLLMQLLALEDIAQVQAF